MAENAAATAVMCFSSGRGGMELDTIKLADLLSEDCRIVLLCKKNAFIHSRIREAAKEYECEPVQFSSRVFSPSMLVRVRKILKKHGVRNVIFFGASELKTLYFSFIGMNLNVIVRHGTTKTRTKRGPVHRLVYSCVDYHVALSKHLLNNAKSILPGGKRARFRVITPSFMGQNTAAQKKDVKSGPLRIIHTGRIAPGKGQAEAVISCVELGKKGIDYRLDLLGGVEDKKCFDYLKSVADGDDAQGRITFHGHVENVGEYMSRADVFLFPSYGEGMPNALIEALHYGLICICFSNTVFPEFEEMGFYMLLAPDRSQQDLTAQLLYVAENLSAVKPLAYNNIKLAKKFFDRDRERNDWKEILL